MSDAATTASINLQKGQKVDLTKTNPGLTIVKIGLGWDVVKNGQDVDLDAAALCLTGGKYVGGQENLCFFNNLSIHGGAILHSGDNLTGAGDGDDEVITIDLSKIPATVDEVLLAVNVYEAQNRRQTFGMVENAFARVILGTDMTSPEHSKFDLSEDQSVDTGFQLISLYRHQGEWKVKALGTGFTGSWTDLIKTLS